MRQQLEDEVVTSTDAELWQQLPVIAIVFVISILESASHAWLPHLFEVLLHALISLLLAELSHLLLLSHASYKRNKCSCKHLDASSEYSMCAAQKTVREPPNDLDTDKRESGGVPAGHPLLLSYDARLS